MNNLTKPNFLDGYVYPLILSIMIPTTIATMLSMAAKITPTEIGLVALFTLFLLIVWPLSPFSLVVIILKQQPGSSLYPGPIAWSALLAIELSTIMMAISFSMN